MTTVKNADGKRIKVSPGAKGSISEHIATAWLLQQGYDVFRNVAPNGRADLLAVNWDKDETIRVDVKSEGFMNGADGRIGSDMEKVNLNQGFEIKYLVVNDDATCGWRSGEKLEAANDNKKQVPQWWRDKKTMQRFLVPGNHIGNKQWTYFCHWLVRAYPDYIVPFKEDFVRDISSRGIGNDRPHISEKETRVLVKLYKHIYGRLLDAEAIDYVDDYARASA